MLQEKVNSHCSRRLWGVLLACVASCKEVTYYYTCCAMNTHRGKAERSYSSKYDDYCRS